jgi:hypothetical protein
MGVGVAVIFQLCVRLTPSYKSAGVNRVFYFSFVYLPWISEFLNFDGFDLVIPAKFPSVSKF